MCLVETFSVNILPTRSVVLGGMLACRLLRAKRFYLRSTDALAKACVGRAALKKNKIRIKKKKPDSKLAWIWIVAIEFKTLAPG